MINTLSPSYTMKIIDSEDENEAETSERYGESTDSKDSSNMQLDRIHMPSALLAENFSKNVAYCERNMWSLSTLGGAYASMSMYAKQWAEMLLQVSVKQLSLATQLNNEPYMCRARIYIAHALATNGDFKNALKLIRKELYFIRHYLKDEFCLNVATAIYTRIKNLQKKAITAN